MEVLGEIGEVRVYGEDGSAPDILTGNGGSIYRVEFGSSSNLLISHETSPGGDYRPAISVRSVPDGRVRFEKRPADGHVPFHLSAARDCLITQTLI